MPPASQLTATLTSRYVGRYARQAASVPTCVTTCMADGDIGGCTSLTDYACLCQSETYSDSVGSCWASNCNATEISIGQAYSQAGCEQFGVTASSSAASTVSSALSTASIATTASSASTVSASTVNTTSSPHINHAAFTNVQAIMSSICSALLILALVLGGMACRTKIRRNREAVQNRTWTGVGSTTVGTDTKKPSLFSRSKKQAEPGVHSSFFSHSRNDATSSAGGLNSTGVTSSHFGTPSSAHTITFAELNHSQLAGNRQMGGINRGFTNRLTLEEQDQEEWEMAVKQGESSGSGSDGEYKEDEAANPESPTTPIGSRGDLEYGSTVHLNKGNGPMAC